MSKKKDLTGKKFGRLTVINQNIELSKEKRAVIWNCICDCGKYKSIRSNGLLSGKTQSCGCLRNERVRETLKRDLKGQKFEKLFVLEEVPIDINSIKTKRVRWLCQCDCGNKIIIDSNNLKSGNTKSCGCYNKQKIRETKMNDLTNKRFGQLVVLELDEEEMEKRKEKNHYDSNAYWKCRCDCGNTLTVKGYHLVHNITMSCGCLCSQGEKIIENFLKENKIQYVHQYKFSELKGNGGGMLYFDFAIFNKNELKALIEYNGKQHYEPIEFFGGKVAFEKQQDNDNKKERFCKDNNIPLYIISYKEDLNNKLKIIKENVYEI